MTAALARLYPGAVWRMDKDGTLDWQDKSPKPDMSKITEEAKRIEADEMAISYQRDRAREYPPIGDQLDAIWKCLNQLRMHGADLPADADHVLGEILAVKRAYPKQEEKDVADD